MVRAETAVRIGTILIAVLLLGMAAGCAKTPDLSASAAASTPDKLKAVPPADPSKFPGARDLANWRNPHLIVRADGIGFVDLANHEIHIRQPEQIPAELAGLAPNAWPYGRVVLVSEAAPANRSEQAKADLRKNRGLLAGTLREMHIEIREAP